MAPGTRRANRSGYAEHDDFEVRQWRYDWVNVAPPPQQEQQQQNDIWSIDLLHGMPKDSSLLPPHSQELLLAARSGRLYKRPAPVEEEDADPDAIPDKPEKKDEDDSAKGFSIKLWKQLPRNVEASAVSHLAKRRKNTVTIASKTIEDRVQGPMVTRAKVRRTDASGNQYTEEVTLADGQYVDGEIISTRVEPAVGLNGQAAIATPQPTRRRPPPPKRKSKAGPGRGKKKAKVPLLGAGQPLAAGVPVNGSAPASTFKPGLVGENGIKQETDDNTNQDSEMADDDDDDDDDEGDEGDEGEDGDEGGETPADSTQHESSIDHEMTDVVPAIETSAPDRPDAEMGDNEVPSEMLAPPNPLSLALPPLNPSPGLSRLEGSPLKNVIMPSPTTEVPPDISLEASSTTEPAVQNVETAGVTTIVESTVPEPTVPGPTSTGPTIEPVIPEPPITETPTAEPPMPEPAMPEPTVVELATTESATIEPPSAVASLEFNIENVIPQTESPRDEALLPPPYEEVGNIATTPSANGSVSMGTDGEEKPAEQTELVNQVLPEEPPSEREDITMTEDNVKEEFSASASLDVSEFAEVSPAEPATGYEFKEPEAPAEPTPEARPVSPANDDVSMAMDAVEEPDLIGGLLGELDRQVDERMETDALELELVAEPAPEPSPQPVPEAVPEAVEPAVEAVETETVVEPAETAVEPVAEPVVEGVIETILETVVEPIAESTVESVVESIVESVVEPTVEPVTELAIEPAGDVNTEAKTELDFEPPTEPVLGSISEVAPESAEPAETETTKHSEPSVQAPENPDEKKTETEEPIPEGPAPVVAPDASAQEAPAPEPHVEAPSAAEEKKEDVPAS
ncbi:hypothetical protein QQZ08_000239 [Neonectria magnoliae]|uniref:Apopolysialoglycoprotein n=1 Tax=Neonectria magnoliae TaxID=2732573 RepID=A0ABR1II35_9HYPO